MPELPEVETVRRGLEPFLKDKIVQSITMNRPDLRFALPAEMGEIFNGRICKNLRRRGKYILMDFDNGQTLVVHLGMSGRFAINPSSSEKHDHVVITTISGDSIVYNDARRFGMMFIVQTGDEHIHPAFATMGPEPFDPDFNGQTLTRTLQNKKTSIKAALLDQSVVAGIGNIYACEALYMAGISPTRIASTIKGKKADKLITSLRTVLEEAIAAGGSTLRDHRQADGTMGYFQHNFKVYGKAGKQCPETGGIIKKITQSGRTTFYCPAKQR